MLRIIFGLFLWTAGWKVKERLPKHIHKYIVVLVPHTSNWDFPFGVASRPFLGIARSKYFIKKEWLDKPIVGAFMKYLGAIGVDRNQKTNLVDQVVALFDANEKMGLAVTPEGTRSLAKEWKTGFYHIAMKAKVPLVCGYMDYNRKELGLGKIMYPTGNMEQDIAEIKAFYSDKLPCYPEKSSIDHSIAPIKHGIWWKIKPWFRGALLLLLVWATFNYELIGYGLMQAYGQLRILIQAKPVAIFLQDPQFPEEKKEKLRLIQDIRRFAFDSLGLKENNSYTSMYDQQGEALLWNVTACEPYRLQAYEWHFPLLGTFSYKGFFQQKCTDKALADLKAKGYDTDMYEVGGWSTLGFLSDPILSNMLRRKEGSLANLIIHELTHGTLYVKDGVAFNENLASFVGDEGAKRFLKHRFGENSPQYEEYLNAQADRLIFDEYCLIQANRLDSLYNTFTSEYSPERKQGLKSAFIAKFVENLATLPFKNPQYAQYFEEELPNNTFFMAKRRYSGEQNKFKVAFEQAFKSDFKQYMDYLKRTYPHLKPY